MKLVPDKAKIENYKNMIILQDGKDVEAVNSLYKFIGALNNVKDLTDADGKFMTFLSNAFDNEDDMFKFIRIVNKFHAYIGNFAFNMKKAKAPVVVPNGEYFLEKYNQAINNVKENNKTPKEASQPLMEEYVKCLKESMEINNKNARIFHVESPEDIATADKGGKDTK